MIDAAAGKRRAGVTGGTRVRLLVATWAEALPLLGFSPEVTGMGRRSLRLDGCDVVLLAGFAGACQPGLRPGDVLLAGAASEELHARLGAVRGSIRTIDHVAGPAEKARLGREGVAAVDMETAWLAAAGVPFLGVRVIIDGLEDSAVSLAAGWHYLGACRALRGAVAAVLEGFGRGVLPSPQPSPAAAGEGDER